MLLPFPTWQATKFRYVTLDEQRSPTTSSWSDTISALVCVQFAWVTEADLRLPVSVHFQNEAGRDEGGVTRDWYSVLSRQMFNEDYGLFTASASDDGTFQVNPNSGVNPDHLDFFRCARC